MAKRKYRKYSNRWRKEFNMIKGFIEKRLRGELISDQLKCKILGESDLQSCVFSHLQKYFKAEEMDGKWPILNEPTLEGVRPDFVICRRKAREYPPKIIIELNSVPSHIEINPNFERIKDTKSVWKLEYLTKNKTIVSLQSYAVIEGIPTFISDFFILESPLYSLNNLKDHF